MTSQGKTESLDPITWQDFTQKYFDAFYPGHELPAPDRRERS